MNAPPEPRPASEPRAFVLLSAAVTDADDVFEACWRRWRQACPDLEGMELLELRLLPLVWRKAQAAGIKDSDDNRLRGIYKKYWFLTRHVLKTAAQVQGDLDTAGIPSVLFKGCSMVIRGYSDVGTRPTSDVDVLVRPQDYRRACGVLREHRPTRRFSPHATSFSVNLINEVDLHHLPSQWYLAQNLGSLKRDSLVQEMILRREPATFEGLDFHVPPIDEMIIASLLNVFAHSDLTSRSHAYWVLDLDVLFRRCAPSPQRMLALIEREGCLSLFQQQFAMLENHIPAAARGFADVLAAAEVPAREKKHQAALAQFPRAPGDAGPAAINLRREWWFAIRGASSRSASLSMKLGYFSVKARRLFWSLIYGRISGWSFLRQAFSVRRFRNAAYLLAGKPS